MVTDCKIKYKIFQINKKYLILVSKKFPNSFTSFENFQFDNSFNLGADGYGDARGYVGAFFGDFANMGAFNNAISNGFLADAMANAEAINAADNWSLAETNVGQMAFYYGYWQITSSINLLKLVKNKR